MPYEVSLQRCFGPNAPAVRSAFHQDLLAKLRTLRAEWAAHELGDDELALLVVQRFSEYEDLLHGALDGKSIMRYSFIATQNISGNADPLLSNRIAADFALTISEVIPALRRVRVFDAPSP